MMHMETGEEMRRFARYQRETMSPEMLHQWNQELLQGIHARLEARYGPQDDDGLEYDDDPIFYDPDGWRTPRIYLDSER